MENSCVYSLGCLSPFVALIECARKATEGREARGENLLHHAVTLGAFRCTSGNVRTIDVILLNLWNVIAFRHPRLDFRDWYFRNIFPWITFYAPLPHFFFLRHSFSLERSIKECRLSTIHEGRIRYADIAATSSCPREDELDEGGGWSSSNFWHFFVRHNCLARYESDAQPSLDLVLSSDMKALSNDERRQERERESRRSSKVIPRHTCMNLKSLSGGSSRRSCVVSMSVVLREDEEKNKLFEVDLLGNSTDDGSVGSSYWLERSVQRK